MDGKDTSRTSMEPRQAKPTPPSPLLDLAAFMATFTCPDYLVDGIIQRGGLHGLTSPTGHGKTALALLLGLHHRRRSRPRQHRGHPRRRRFPGRRKPRRPLRTMFRRMPALLHRPRPNPGFSSCQAISRWTAKPPRR